MRSTTRSPSARARPALLLCASLAACQGIRSTMEPQPPAEPPLGAAGADPQRAASAPSCGRPAEGLGVEPLDPSRGSSVVLGRAEGRVIALVADADTHRLHTVDVTTMRQLAVTTLSGTPSQLILLSTGRVAVALRDTNSVELLDFRASLREPLAHACSADVPTEPVALAAAEGALLVVSRWAGTVTALDLPSGEAGLSVRGEVAVSRDPAALAVTGGAAWVLHASGGDLDRIPLSRFTEARGHGVAAEEVRTRGLAADDRGKLVPNEVARRSGEHAPRRRATQGFALAATADGHVQAALVLAAPSPPENPELPTGYGVGFDAMINELAVVSPKGAVSLTQADNSGQADCPLPRDAAFSSSPGRHPPHGAPARQLVVACAGNDRLVVYSLEDGAKVVRGRYHVGAGPSGLAVDDATGHAYVWSTFDGVLTSVSLDGSVSLGQADQGAGHRAGGPSAVVLREESVLDAERELGRRLFHESSSRVSQDGRACASCHPDGRDDGLTWRTDEGPRQTPMLVGRIEGTAPYGWNGDLPLPGHFERTVRRLSGQGLEPFERDAIFAYLKGLEAPGPAAGPVLVAKGREGELVDRGAAIFHSEEAQCGGCHVGGTSTDALPHDVRSGHRKGDTPSFDTPSLRFVGKSAPYYHDGRYGTLEDLLRGSDHAMGNTGHLAEGDRSALLAYLRSL